MRHMRVIRFCKRSVAVEIPCRLLQFMILLAQYHSQISDPRQGRAELYVWTIVMYV